MSAPVPVLLMVRTLTSGGTERQTATLARSLDPARFTPHVACFRAEGFRAEELRRAGVPLLELPVRSFMKPDVLRAGRMLRDYVRENSIRLVHTFDYPANIFGVPAAKFAGVPRVLGSQRGYRTVYPSKYRLLLRVSDRLADGIVVNCEAMRRHLREDYSVPDHKIHLCHNGLDTSLFHPGPRPPRDGVTIGAVSVLRPEKGLDCLLEGFALARAARPEARLLVVGSGPTGPALEAQAAALGIRDACRFEPATSDVVPWLHAIDIFVLPSLFEALSNSLMEAMACGCCAVASRVGGNPELIEDGVTGLLFERANARSLADQLIRLIDDPELRRRLAERAACRIASDFSVQASAARMQEIYSGFLRA